MSKKKHIKRTQRQKQYIDEIGKLKSIITRNLNLGYEVNYETIFKLTNFFQMPKRVTQKQIEAIKEIRKPDYFHENFTNKYNNVSFENNAPEGFNQSEWFKQRVKQEKETKPFEYPQWLESLLNSVPDVREFYWGRGNKIGEIDTSNMRNTLMEILDHQITIHNKYNIGYKYTEYLYSQESRIADLIDKITHINYEEVVRNCFTELGEILNMGSLSISQTRSLSQLGEVYEEGYDE